MNRAETGVCCRHQRASRSMSSIGTGANRHRVTRPWTRVRSGRPSGRPESPRQQSECRHGPGQGHRQAQGRGSGSSLSPRRGAARAACAEACPGGPAHEHQQEGPVSRLRVVAGQEIQAPGRESHEDEGGPASGDRLGQGGRGLGQRHDDEQPVAGQRPTPIKHRPDPGQPGATIPEFHHAAGRQHQGQPACQGGHPERLEDRDPHVVQPLDRHPRRSPGREAPPRA